jgi:hypothetical protein
MSGRLTVDLLLGAQFRFDAGHGLVVCFFPQWSCMEGFKGALANVTLYLGWVKGMDGAWDG